ncbi:hypothetical protein ACFLXD_03280 [Chloroflexota bacterium]
MNKILAPGSFILIIIGTLGLLANEFIFDWGSSATLTFAVFNLVGLAALALSYWSTKKA